MMIRKLSIWFTLILLVLPLVLAFEEGEVYTQQQVDSVNFDGFTYVDLQCRNENIIFFKNNVVHHFYSCLGLDKKNITHYEVERDYYTIHIPVEQMEWCVQTYGWEVCMTHYDEFLRNGWTIPMVETVIKRLKGFQQDYLNPTYREWFENRVLFP